MKMKRSDFRKLTSLRIKEAEILLDNKCYEGAYYLAGYAIECALKACIAKKTRAYDFPPKEVRDYYSHNLKTLIKIADLESALNSEIRAVAGFGPNWDVVKDWSEQTRYETKISAQQAKDLYFAITDATTGVLTWLKKHW